ncbi:MAG: beta-ketoacyl synthase N-terminal-like domain-containing protein, partial [Phycisphaerae bacterium]
MGDSVVITGMGIVSPIGCGERTFWDSLCQGRSGAAPVDGLNTSELPRKIACQVREPIDVAPPPGGRPRSSDLGERSSDDESNPPPLKRWGTHIGRASRLTVAASRHAVSSAGIIPHDVEAGRFAIIIGTTMGETEFIEERLDAPESEWLSADHMRRIISGRPGCIARNVQADLAGWLTSSDAGEQFAEPRPSGSGGDESSPPSLKRSAAQTGPGVSARAEARGSATDLYGACAAGNMALAAARRQILDGRCDVALAGGADGFSRLAFLGFMRLRIMAAEVCRPFDEKRDGLFVGEGAVVFLLEREASARARGAPIRARISGAGITCEDYHPTRPHPDGDGLTRATKDALRDAGLVPADIDYVCAHGTGTPQNDAIEVKVMENCFPDGVCFSSIKALTGHTMGAAAAME